MDATKARIAIIFGEWQRRYREEPDAFMADWEIAAEGVEEYGVGAARYFLKLGAELDAAGALPAPVAA